jgi:peptidoglycan/LPS O-acetylase OafA/YrhL
MDTGLAQLPSAPVIEDGSVSIPDTRFRLGHVSAFDGLRAIAVLSVILFHSDAPWWIGGYIGVDIFFVLSGFLITGLLIEEYQKHGRIRFLYFYLRRGLRLFPALFLILAVYLVFFLSVEPEQWALHLNNVRLVVLYSVNINRANGSNEPYFLGHAWSLSIEEQFYLVWPWVFALLYWRASRWLRVFFVGGTALAAWWWRITLLAHDATIVRVYNGFDTRADALLVGCTLALAISMTEWQSIAKSRTIAIVSELLAFISLVILVFIARFVIFKDPLMLRYGYFIVALCSALMIVHLYIGRSYFLAPILEFRPLIWIGKISYGLYLWHYPIMRYMLDRFHFDWVQTLIFGGTLTFACATLSYYLVEQRCLRLRHRFAR